MKSKEKKILFCKQCGEVLESIDVLLSNYGKDPIYTTLDCCPFAIKTLYIEVGSRYKNHSGLSKLYSLDWESQERLPEWTENPFTHDRYSIELGQYLVSDKSLLYSKIKSLVNKKDSLYKEIQDKRKDK